MTKTMNTILQHLSQDGIGAFPCDTIWGLIGRMSDTVAMRLQALKNRTETKPFIILIPSKQWLFRVTDLTPNSPLHEDLLNRYWPGPVSFIFTKNRFVPNRVSAGLDSIAVRWPLFPPLNQLLSILDYPLISSSLNTSGQTPVSQPEEIPIHIQEKLDFIYTDAKPPEKTPSSVIDLRESTPHCLRKGALWESISAYIIKKH